MTHKIFLDAACAEARQSVADGGIATGAVLVKGGEIVARSHDRTAQLNDPIAVAELDCIRRAGRRSDQSDLILYSTRYPDMLCAGTVVQFSIGAVVIGLDKIDSPVLALLQAKNVPVTFFSHRECAALQSS